MPQKRLLWQLFPSYLLITILSMVTFSIYAYYILDQIYFKVKSADLQSRVLLIENQVADLLESDPAKVDSLCKILGKKASTRFTVIKPDGEVIADSDEEPGKMDNHARRPEIAEALSGSVGTSLRYSHTIEMELLYVAFPLIREDRMVAIIRAAVPLTFIEQTLTAFKNRFIIFGLGITGVIALISLMLTRRISKPLENMRSGVERFANGELTYRIEKPGSKEMERLTDALNAMAAQLGDKIKTIIEQKNEQEAVLEGMVESVVALDREKNIININRAAAKIFKVDAREAIGRSALTVLHNNDLIELVDQTMRGKEPVEAEIVLKDMEKYFLQVHGTVLRDAHEEIVGAVIVLNDVTRLRRLEKVRRDFVANVSHEIRTPLTSIKGFAETLLDGAIAEPDTAKEFVKIICKQSNRLNAIIEDLLILARLEQEEERTLIEFSSYPLKKVLKSAIQLCQPKAANKAVDLVLKGESDIKLRMNPDLFEQAVVNLIDNAIKFSPENSPVDISVTRNGSHVNIGIKDYGVGIHKKHLPRLFERFYRIDKARSRNLGGTGLGLAIVKHIVQVHGGNVTVKSKPGKGSQFTIELPESEQLVIAGLDNQDNATGKGKSAK